MAIRFVSTEEYVAAIEKTAAEARRAAAAVDRVAQRVEATTAEAVTLARAKAIVSKSAAPVPMRDALDQVWREDPELFTRYRREQRAATPRTGARPAPRTDR